MTTVSFGDKSRLIIKNIPNSLDNKLLDKLISKKCRDIGVTKCDLKLLTKEKKVNKEVKRVSRGICYVGFASERDATKFLNHYDNSYFNSCKVSIEYSKSPGTVEKKEEKFNGVEKVKATEGGQVVVEKEVVPRKAGVASKQVHIKFDSEDSDNKESDGDEDFIDRRVDRKSVRMELLEQRDRMNRKDRESDENMDNDHVSSQKEVDMNRVVIFNLPYSVTEEAIRSLVKPFGKVEQIHIPLNKYDYSDPSSMESRATKGMCYVTFCFESDAVNFMEQKNKSIFSGRIITIALAKSQQRHEDQGSGRIDKYHNKRRNEETYSKFKMKKRKEEVWNPDIWNILHIDIHAAIRTISAELGVGSEEILKDEEAGVNVALSESYILNKLKKWLENQGVNYDVGDYDKEDLHEDTLMIKNLPYNSDDRELIRLFGSCGQIVRFATSPYKLLGLVQYSNKHECEKAFRTLSYKMYKSLPIYLQRVAKQLLPNSEMIKSDPKLIEEAKEGVYSDHVGSSSTNTTRVSGIADAEGQAEGEHSRHSHKDDSATNLASVNDYDHDSDDDNDDESTKETNNRIGHVSVYVSNIDASVDEEELDKHFASLKGYVISKIIRPIQSGSEDDKSKADRPRYGFIEFDSIDNAKEAIKRRCGTVIAGKLINVELSKNNQTISKHSKKKQGGPTEENDVIIVKNLPFQATKKELTDLFKHYANVKTVRIPKSAGNTHRGFGFVEFMSKNDAKTAMENLKNVHLYGRRLVLQYVENTK